MIFSNSNTYNMKQISITVSLLFLVISVFGQVTKKEVDNGVFVTFPSNPEYQITTGVSTYMAETKNCYYMVLIQRNTIPYYPEFVKAEKTWTEAQKKQVRDSLLNGAIKGILDYTGSTRKISEIKKGTYFITICLEISSKARVVI